MRFLVLFLCLLGLTLRGLDPRVEAVVAGAPQRNLYTAHAVGFFPGCRVTAHILNQDSLVERYKRPSYWREAPGPARLFRAEGFDKGHLTPFEDLQNTAGGLQTFASDNCVPEYFEHNRGTWKDIENAVRRMLLTNKEILVITGAVYRYPALRAGPEDVPDSMWKIAVGDKETLCWITPNRPDTRGDESLYRVSLDEVLALAPESVALYIRGVKQQRGSSMDEQEKMQIAAYFAGYLHKAAADGGPKNPNHTKPVDLPPEPAPALKTLQRSTAKADPLKDGVKFSPTVTEGPEARAGAVQAIKDFMKSHAAELAGAGVGGAGAAGVTAALGRPWYETAGAGALGAGAGYGAGALGKMLYDKYKASKAVVA